MWQMITNATSMPCHDFFDTVKDGVAQGMTKAIQKRLKRRRRESHDDRHQFVWQAAISLDVNKATEHEIKGVIEEWSGVRLDIPKAPMLNVGACHLYFLG